jgi:hypothetical protein
MGKSKAGIVMSQVGESSRLTSYMGHTLSQADTEQRLGSSGYNFDSKTAEKPFNVLRDYRWTLSKQQERDDLPYIVLDEHRNTESSIMRMFKFYSGGVIDSAKDIAAQPKEVLDEIHKQISNHKTEARPKGLLSVYDDIFPDNPTNRKYIFPYFTKKYMELSTPNWTQIDSIGDALNDITGGMQDVSDKFQWLKGFTKTAETINAAVGFGSAVGTTALKFAYPLVGTIDRPRVFATHNERSVAIEFPLYNTIHHEDWIKNLTFLNVFMTQNLFNKRDYITGYPPCYYRVYVPGQYFCFASSIQNIDIENLGNVRLLKTEGREVAVPDAYQVKITLQEMVIPSLNQFQSLFTGDARSRVKVDTV